jgi:biotin carboxyl carrier protein
VMVNDLSLGKYDVVIESGPSYHTQRQESAQQLIDLAQSSPIFEQVAIDLIAKNLNVLENDELTKRIRRVMIKNGTVEPTEEEIEALGLNQPQPPSQSEQALIDSVESQTVLNTSTAINKDADTEKKRAQAAETEAKTLKILVDTILAKIEKGIPITPLERSILVKQGDIVREGQQAMMDGPNSEELADIVRMLPQQ